MGLATVILKKGKEKSLERKHPWVFSGAIYKIVTDNGLPPENGGLVKVLDPKEQFLAQGFFADGTIAVRVITFKDEAIDQDFWNNKIQEAYSVREAIGLTESSETNMYRLFHGEGDGVPGLIIDFYNGTAVIQAHNGGVHDHIEQISKAIQHTYGDALSAIYDKSAEALAKQNESTIENGYIYESKKPALTGSEYGYQFNLDWVDGQKTGFFIDQRENRKLLGDYAKGKSVLNTFCYSGGFSVSALANGAESVHSVDSSQKAIDLTNANIALNGLSNHEAYCEDTMDFLKKTDNSYDIIVLDPPAYAKNQRAKHNAVQGYRRLNEMALNKIKPGGLLFTFSCSQAVHRKLFYDTITAAAINAGRTVRVLHHLSQPADHPVNIYHPEGEYLKGLVLKIE